MGNGPCSIIVLRTLDQWATIPLFREITMTSSRFSFLLFLVTLAHAPLAVEGQTIGAGNQHSVFLCAPGVLSASGSDHYGQLGNNSTEDWNTAAPVAMTNEVTMVSVQQQQAIALGADSTVWTWGQRVGTVDVYDSIPYHVPGLAGIIQVAMGFAHAAALRSDGTVWMWGSGLFGQLGQGVMGPGTVSLSPVQVPGLTGVTAIATGGYHTLALVNDGSIRAWGLNANGQLGDVTVENRPSPVNVVGPTATAVAAGNNHSLLLRANGSIWAWGANGQGQLGDGSIVDKSGPVPSLATSGFTSVKAGVLHSLALKSDGTAWAWGYNLYGRLGDGTQMDRHAPVQITGLGNVVEITGGAGHSLARTADGGIWAWGNNEWGQLAIGSNTNSLVPVRVSLECGFTAIAEPDDVPRLSVHPNPFRDEVAVRSPLLSKGGHFILYDACGRAVIPKTPFARDPLLVQRGGLPAGAYILLLVEPNGVRHAVRLMAEERF
ncbi:MAG: hypothetical protein KDC01_04095 [Flavobacteriales bacterium]|nr:hypothetical protein [Flavobacteriales bacterium]